MSNDNKNDFDEDKKGPKMPFRTIAVWFLLLAIGLTVYQLYIENKPQYAIISYSDFNQFLEKGDVKSALIINEGTGVQSIRGILKKPDIITGGAEQFSVDIMLTDETLERIRDRVPDVAFKAQSPYLREVLTGAIPFILVLALLYFFFIRQMKNAGKGAMSFGRSRAKMLTRSKNKVTFKDVAGIEEAQEELEEIVDFLQDPKRFQNLGGRIPKGVLLSGPPGTGKTLLGKAIAGEAGVPFFSISGSDFVEMFVGVGASRVRDMFEQGRKNAPCIIFIDEIDAVGRSRFSGIGGGHDEREQTLNALLVEMDGFDTQEGIIILAATNRPDVLDDALTRPGRFDRQVVVDLPALEGREKILKIHSKKVKLHRNVNLKKVARGTPGFSGADLANLINESALLAARRRGKAVQMHDLEEARDKVRFGRERRSRMMDDKEKELTAYHEAGHAIVLATLDHTEPVHKVTIIPRGQSLGSTMQLPKKDNYTHSKKKLEAMLVGFMGGRAAEELIYGDVTTGASNDIKQSTAIARAMICEYGMNEDLGPQALGAGSEPVFVGREVGRQKGYSEKTAQLVDKEVSTLLKDSYKQAMDILKKYRTALETMTKLLLERETIDGQEVEEIIRFDRILSPEERAEHYPDLEAAVPLEEASDASDDEAGKEDKDTPPDLGTPPEASPA